MNVQITGASGFVGKNLSAYLVEQSYTVLPVSLRNENWSLKTSANDVSAIIHLAGKAHDTANASSPSEYFKINRDLTVAVFDAFLQSDTKDFIYFSSVKAVADTVDGTLSEDVVPRPLTPYGQSKYEAEQYLLAQKLPTDKRLFIIRPCMIHGPGNKGNLNLLYKVVEKGLPWPLAAFKNERSFLSIQNLNFLIGRILSDKEVPSGVYNFSDDKSLSTNDVVSLISGTLGKKPRLMNISPKVIGAIARIGNKLRLPLNSERLKKLTESYVVSNSKIKGVLRLTELPLSAEEGLKVTIKSFQKSHE